MSKPPIPYNEQAVRKVAKTKHAKQTDYRIDGVPGLTLTVFNRGTAGYAVRYTVKGKQRRASIGDYAVMSLADARAKALKVAAGLNDDVDILAKEVKDANRLTLRALWKERVERDDRRAPQTMEDYERVLSKDIFPQLGDRFADEITADDLADVLEVVEDRSPRVAHVVRSALSGTFRWAQGKRLVRHNPLSGLGFHHQSKPRKRVLTDAEMVRLLRAIPVTKGITEPMRNIIRLAILTGQRNSEVAGMEIAELKGLDTATPRWTIPGARMKRKDEDQHVPLSRQALAVIVAALTEANGKHVFPGEPNGRREGVWRQEHMGQQSVSRAMAKVALTAKLDDVHLHDMRKCITSWLAEHGHASPEVLDAILHHGRRGVTGTHYNFALYEKQVRGALQVWADHVEGLALGASVGSKVVALRG